MQHTSHSDNETIAIGKKISSQLKGGDVVCLYGELGAGKTTLVKGIAEGLRVKEEIKSPTFTLMNVYKIGDRRSSPYGGSPEGGEIGDLVHIDTYRLKDEQELIEIGVEDYLGEPNTVCVVEWPQKLETLLAGKNLIKITLNHVKEGRKIVMKSEK